jgi:hypothetical protein
MRFGGRASLPKVRRGGLGALAIACVALIAGCGGSAPHKAVAAVAKKATPATLVAETVGSAGTIESGRIDVTLDVTLDGVKQLDGKPIVLEVSGPFTRDAGGLSADLALTLSAAQANVTAGLDIIDGAIYVGLGGQFYKLRSGGGPPAGATGITGATGGATGASGMTGHEGFGFDPSTWLTSPHIVGNADIGGVTTEHLHALINVPNVLAELTRLLSGATGASGASSAAGASGASGATGTSGTTAPTISALSLLESAIDSATVDIYTGVADHIVRRVQVAVAFTVPAIAAGLLGGLSGGSLDFEATLTDLNKPQSITAPANAQPASKLLNGVLALESQFGSLAPFVKELGSMAGLGGTGGSFGGLFATSHRSGAADSQG